MLVNPYETTSASNMFMQKYRFFITPNLFPHFSAICQGIKILSDEIQFFNHKLKYRCLLNMIGQPQKFAIASIFFYLKTYKQPLFNLSPPNQKFKQRHVSFLISIDIWMISKHFWLTIDSFHYIHLFYQKYFLLYWKYEHSVFICQHLFVFKLKFNEIVRIVNSCIFVLTLQLNLSNKNQLVIALSFDPR